MSNTPPTPEARPNTYLPQGLAIRARVPGDAAEIAAMHNMPGYRYGTLRLPHHTPDEVRKAIENPPSGYINLVAMLDGRIVGDIGLNRFPGRRAHVGSIGMGVHDDFQRRGIGRALMGEIITIADDWYNLRRLELTVFIDNAPAIALYESFGFEREGTHRQFAYRAGAYVDAYAMARIRP